MATFTIALKDVITLTGGSTVIADGVTKMTGGNIGLGYYPIFDATYKDHLDGIIIDHYWNSEIGQESIPMFQLAMRRKMNEIMPLYNKLYESEKIAFDPLSTVNLKTLTTGESLQISDVTAESNTDSENTSSSRSVNSETPQTMLSGNADYATAASDVNGLSNVDATATETSNSTTDASQTGESTVTGYQGAASELLMRYRDSLLNIDLMIVRDLESLFMLVWDNGDSYTKGYY